VGVIADNVAAGEDSRNELTTRRSSASVGVCASARGAASADARIRLPRTFLALAIIWIRVKPAC
jgi:hypothetical protein